jgi:hypothetical protein
MNDDKCAADISDALIVIARSLGRGRAVPRERDCVERQLETACDFFSQQGCLVEAAPPEPPPVERHRNDQIVFARRNRQLLTEIFGQRAARGLIEAIFMTTDQRRQSARLIFSRSAITSDRSGFTVVRANG